MECKKKKHKFIAIICLDVVIVIALIIYFGVLNSHTTIHIHGTYIPSPLAITEFHCIDNHGMPFSKKNLQGRWSIIFFGFSSCEMICPTTLAELNKMYQRLQGDLPKEQLPQVIFISVDPERDSVQKLNKFINSFNPNFIGLRASEAQTLALAKQFHITVSQGATINHSMEILLINPDARVQAYFAYPHHAQQLVVDYKQVLKRIF